MRIKTQFVLTMFFFGAMLIFIAVSSIVTAKKIGSLTGQEELAADIERAAGELGYLSNEYLLYRELQQKKRWESSFETFSNKLSQLAPVGPEQEDIVRKLRVNQRRLRMVFGSIESIPDGIVSYPNLDSSAILRISWSRMAVQNLEMVFDAKRLTQLLHNRANRLTYTINALIVSLFGLFGLFLVLYYLLFYRRTLQAISVMQSGIKIIGSGNLDHRIEGEQNDEIGELAHAFNLMTANLREVTTSRESLQIEINGRKKAERMLAADLEATTWLQRIGARFVKAGELTDALGEIVDAAIAITHADMGNIQLLDPQTGALRIVAHRGFGQPFLDFWNAAGEDQGACGTALKKARRVIIEDVAESRVCFSAPALEVQLNAGVRSVQSTPLFGHSGAPIGILSTHRRVPGRPDERDLQLLDLLAQEAVDIIELARAKDALRENEQRFRQLAEASFEGLLIHNDGVILDVNSPLTEITGFTREELIGRYILDFIDPAYHELMRREQRAPYEIEIIHRNGGMTPVEVMVKSFVVPGQVVVAVRDITDRKKAEEKSRKDTILLNQTGRIAKVGGWEIDVATMTQNWTDETYEIHEVDKNTYNPNVDREINSFSPESRPIIEKAVYDAIHFGKPYDLELEFITAKGAHKITRAIGDVEVEHGKTQRVYGIFQDITAQKRTEEALRKSEEKFRSIVETANEGIILADTDEKMNFVNKKMADMLGYTVDELIGRSCPDFMTGEEKEKALARRTKLGMKNQLQDEFCFFRKDGSYLWTIGSATPISNDKGEHIGNLFMHTDITERRWMEEELRSQTEMLIAANKELESFSYSISHDLRAPLRAIKGFSTILLQENLEKLDAESRDFLHRIDGGANKMGALIDDMLRLSKISRQEMCLQEIDLSAFAASVLKELRLADPERKAETVIAQGLKATCDARLIQLALSNLIGNAWKYSSKTPNARIEFASIEKSGKTIYLVRDNGAGFDMSHAHKLLTPFQRLHSESEFPGTGVGLAIVNRVIQRHGGRVWGEGEPGKGATFYFTLFDDIYIFKNEKQRRRSVP